jgi:hypothetical protein
MTCKLLLQFAQCRLNNLYIYDGDFNISSDFVVK